MCSERTGVNGNFTSGRSVLHLASKECASCCFFLEDEAKAD